MTRWTRWWWGITARKGELDTRRRHARSFDWASQEWLVRFVEHRIGDKRIIRLIQKWLKAGVLEDGVVTTSDRGTGQGSAISPLLANVYLHSVFNLLGRALETARGYGRHDHREIKPTTSSSAFSTRATPDASGKAMCVRLGEFALSLHPDKTRLIGSAALLRPVANAGPGQTGDLRLPRLHLHLRQSRATATSKSNGRPELDRMRAKLKQVKEGLRRRMRRTIAEQGRWLEQVVAGCFNSFAVPTNNRAPGAFSRHHILDLWRRTLERRSQQDRKKWDRMDGLARRVSPRAPSSSPRPKASFRRQTPEVGAVCGKAARTDLSVGRAVMRVPTAIEALASQERL